MATTDDVSAQMMDDHLPSLKKEHSDKMEKLEDEGVVVSHKESPESRIFNEEDGKDAVKPSLETGEVLVNGKDTADIDDEVEVEDLVERIKRNQKMVVDSDDEEIFTPFARSRKNVFMDSDSEDEKRKSFSGRRKMHIIDSDDDSDDKDISASKDVLTSSTTGGETEETLAMPPMYNKDIFDAETSEEEENRSQGWEEQGETSDGTSCAKMKKKKLPTVKERQQELTDIHSDAQRMVRESTISLPYHRAKQRTLADFLNRKKTIPKLTQVKGSLKRSMKSMDTVKELEQRKQDAEEFYKSASEGEDDDDKEWKPGDEKKEEGNSENEDDEMVTLDSLLESDRNIVQPGENQGKDVLEAENQTGNDLSTSEERLGSIGHQDKVTADGGTNNSDIAGEDDQESKRNSTNDSGVVSGCSSATEESQPEEEEDSKSEEDKDLDSGLMDRNQDVESQNSGKDLGSQWESHSSQKDQDQTTAEPLIKGETVTPKICFLAKKIPGLDVSKIAMTTPKLSMSDEGDFIDLDDEVVRKTPPNQSGVLEFMKRFFKHSTAKKKPAEKQNITLSIVSKEKDVDGNEKLITSNVDFCTSAEEKQVGEQVPGAAHRALRSTLQAKIREQREKERQRREKEKQFMESEEVVQDFQDDLPNEEEEMEDVEETDVETESEPEENDIIIKDRKRKKSKFVDEEAEEDEDEIDEEADDEAGEYDDDGDTELDEDDDDGSAEVDESDAEMEKIKENIKSIIDNNDSNGVDQMNTEQEDDNGNEDDLHLCLEETQDFTDFKKKPLSRKPTEDIFATQPEEKILNKSGSTHLERDTSINSMDSSFDLFGSVIPGHQPGGGMKNERRNNSNIPLLTPSVKDRSINSEKEEELDLPELREGSYLSHTGFPTPRSNLHLTPLADSQFPHIKEAEIPKLKLDFSGVAESQSEDDLIGLCSGTFSDVKKKKADDIAQLCSEDGLNPTQEINEMVGLCSGQFTNSKNAEEVKFPRLLGTVSDEPDTELLGLCTGRFTQSAERQDSEVTVLLESESCNARDTSDTEDVIKQKKHVMVVESSDEEGSSRNMMEEKRKTKRKRKRIVLLSDDEDGLYYGDSLSPPMFDDEENSLEAIEYDEEENEILKFTGFKDSKKGGIRADFVEKEAELSGSEEESEDEEEPDEDNDFMEMEEGDQDRFDQENLRNQVGRAHLKTLLDSDQRQLRLLQELYLEDGDLHGQGRQRKFRWSGVDRDDDQVRTASDNENSDEEEAAEDAEWRKQRHEREKFLLEMRKKDNVSSSDFKLDKVPLLRSVSYTSTKKDPLQPSSDQGASVAPSSGLNPFSLKSKRGSFLTRGKDSLDKLAELIKDKGNSTIGGAKQSGNFVFQHLSAEEVQEKKEKQKKLSAKSVSDTNVKRPRIERSFFSMDETSRSSSIFKHF